MVLNPILKGQFWFELSTWVKFDVTGSRMHLLKLYKPMRASNCSELSARAGDEWSRLLSRVVMTLSVNVLKRQLD